MEKFVYFFESLSIWVGRAFGWCILILTLSVTYEVFVRYVLNAPTVWVFDMMVQMYGALFLMAGAYALAQDAHVRGDVLYRLFAVRTQAWIDLILYIFFFIPGMLALVWFGYEIASDSFSPYSSDTLFSIISVRMESRSSELSLEEGLNSNANSLI